ncbi:MAG TPA: Ig-like domain-containing protein [bacterium]|nr:Ig-like domain-containing protein [bacterium]
MVRFTGLFIFFCLIQAVAAQPVHQRLIAQHSLDHGDSTTEMAITQTNGRFLPGQGYQTHQISSQMFIALTRNLPPQGTFAIDVLNFDPANQNTSEKQPLVSLLSQPHGTKDIFYGDGSWAQIRTGQVYTSGVPGEAGFKIDIGACGLDSREDVRLLENATWNPEQRHEFKMVWTTGKIYFILDGAVLMQAPFVGQIEPFRYFYIGRTNQGPNYGSQPGLIYSNLRLYEAGEPLQDTLPPILLSAHPINASLLHVEFNEPIDEGIAVQTARYVIAPDLDVYSAQVQPGGREVQLQTAEHKDGQTYRLTVTGIADCAEPANLLEMALMNYVYRFSGVQDVLPPHCLVDSLDIGDPCYSDRPYLLTHLPDSLRGRIWVVTANDDKLIAAEEFITFTVLRRSRITVAYDLQITPLPAWLQNWRQTGAIIRTEDSDFVCYQKTFDAGRVSLGGNSGGNSSSMYLILVELLDDSVIDTRPPDPPVGLRVEVLP